MNHLWQDLRYGLRALLRQPLFTTAAVLVLALGIGANTALFSLVNAVLLQPLPYPNPNELLVLLGTDGDRTLAACSLPDYLDWRAGQRSFTDLALVRRDSFNFSRRGQVPERVIGGTITANYFDVLGVRPAIGRAFTELEDTPNGDKVAMISDSLWRRRYNGDPAVLGKEILLDDVSRKIVGVLPSSLEWPQKAEVFVPLANLRQNKFYLDRGDHFGFVPVGRLKPGVTEAQAGRDLENIALELSRRYPKTNAGARLLVRSWLEYRVGDYRHGLYVLLGAVGCVLLIACANVANLQLARAMARRRELAVRTALGASRGRLVGQMLTEGALLGGLGGVAGVLLAFWALDAMVALSPADVPRFHEAHLNWSALGFAAVLALGAGVLAGVWPAWRITGNSAMAAALHEGSARGGSGGASQGRARAVLVVAQVALAVVLLAGAGLLCRSFWRARSQPLGFQAEGVLTANVALPASRYASKEQQVAFGAALVERVGALPGVSSAAIGSGVPFSGSSSDGGFHITGTPPSEPGKAPEAVFNVASPGYFRAMGITLSLGRDFGPQDDLKQPKVVIIDELLAQRFFPGKDPIGQHLDYEDERPPMAIVGVVAHVRVAAPGVRPEYETMAQTYYSSAQVPQPDMTLVVRTAAPDPLNLVGSVRRAVQSLDADLPLARIRTMEDNVAGDFVAQRATVTLLATFAAVALLLASIGLYGVMALSVTQRTRELGIRLALGAARGNLLALVIRQGMTLVCIGLAIGLLVAVGAGRLLASVLYGVSGSDPATLAVVSLVLGAAASLACWLPALRATRVDPMVALRNE